jgi:hypothetical protein
VVGKYQLFEHTSWWVLSIGFFQKAFQTSLVLALLLGSKADFWLVFGKYISGVDTHIALVLSWY